MEVSIKYDEILQRLPEVRAHNCQNPYADIFPIVVGINLPIVNDPDWVLLEKELFIYVAPAVVYEGAREIRSADCRDGVLIITNKRVAFNDDDDFYYWPIGDVVACEIVNDELLLIKTNMITYTFMVNKEVAPIARIMVRAAKFWHDSGHDLFESQEQSKNVIESIQQSDFYQSLRREYEELMHQK